VIGLTFLRHCERSEAIQDHTQELDCFVASLLAMTNKSPSCFNGCYALRLPVRQINKRLSIPVRKNFLASPFNQISGK
jgi:hypothetical protein